MTGDSRFRLLYVHGFGGEDGGSLESGLAAASSQCGIDFRTLRWPSGSLVEMVRNRAVGSALSLVAGRPISRTIASTGIDVRRHWVHAKSKTVTGVQRLLAEMQRATEECIDFGILGFSLGGRVVGEAIESLPLPPAGLRAIVIAGGAMPATRVSSLVRPGWEEVTVANIFSRNDEVLRSLYPLVEKRERLAGAQPIEHPGVEDVELECGHLSYQERADDIVELALSHSGRARRLNRSFAAVGRPEIGKSAHSHFGIQPDSMLSATSEFEESICG